MLLSLCCNFPIDSSVFLDLSEFALLPLACCLLLFACQIYIRPIDYGSWKPPDKISSFKIVLRVNYVDVGVRCYLVMRRRTLQIHQWRARLSCCFGMSYSPLMFSDWGSVTFNEFIQHAFLMPRGTGNGRLLFFSYFIVIYKGM